MSDTSAFAYDSAAEALALGELRWTEDDIRVVLVSEQYQPRQSADRSLSDIGSARVNEPVRLLGRQLDRTAGRVGFKAQGIRFPRYTGEFRYAVFFNARTEQLVAYSDLGPQKVTNILPVVNFPDGEVCEFVIE